MTPSQGSGSRHALMLHISTVSSVCAGSSAIAAMATAVAAVDGWLRGVRRRAVLPITASGIANSQSPPVAAPVCPLRVGSASHCDASVSRNPIAVHPRRATCGDRFWSVAAWAALRLQTMPVAAAAALWAAPFRPQVRHLWCSSSSTRPQVSSLRPQLRTTCRALKKTPKTETLLGLYRCR